MTETVERDPRDVPTEIVDLVMQRRAAGGPGTTSIVPGMVLASEREPGPWISCAPCSIVMAAHAVTGTVPATLAAAHKVRSSAGRPHEGGMTSLQIDTGLQKAYGVNLGLVRKADIPARLKAGWVIAVFLTYSKLPVHFRRWCPSFGGAHSETLAGWSNDRAGIYDPLATRGYGGEWIRWADLSPALWGVGHLGGAMKAAGGGGGGGDDMRYANASSYYDDSVKRLAVRKDAEWFYLDGVRGGAFSGDATVVALGAVPSADGGGWVVVIGTGSPYTDKVTRPTVAWVKSGTLSTITPPVEPPMPDGDGYDEGYAAGKRDEWDAWAAGLGVPQPPE